MNSNRFNKLNLYLSLLALTIGVVIGIVQISQSKKVNLLTFNEHANEYRPILRLINKPSISIKDVKVKREVGNLVDVAFAVERNYKFINDGNTDAFFLLYSCIDTLTNNPDFIRDFILHFKTTEKIIFRTVRLDGFFKTHIFKGDTLNLTIADSIQGSKQILNVLTKEYISHLIIFYQNSEGILYDTDVMTKFDINQPLLGLGSTYIYWDKSMWHNSFVFKESTNNSKYYTKKETSKIITLYHRTFKKNGV
jgi:hypothetical protein